MKNNTEELALQNINNYLKLQQLKQYGIHSRVDRLFVQHGEPRKNPLIYGHLTSK